MPNIHEESIYIQLAISGSERSNIFEYIENGILITDCDSKIVYANPAFSRICGYSNEELLGRNPGMLHSGRHDKKFYEAMWNSLKEKGYWEGEIWNRRKSGEIFPVYLTISSLIGVDNYECNYIAIISDISYLKKDVYKKLKLAMYDPLTELPNRTLYRDRVSHALKHAKTNPDIKHAILFMDLDKFKQVNDTYGHLVGDTLLKLVAERLSSVMRAGDTIARVGGDEFTAIFNNITNQSDIKQLTHRIVETIEKPFIIDGHKIEVSISIGVCIYPADGHLVDDLLAGADKAMYKAKRDKSKVEFYHAPA